MKENLAFKTYNFLGCTALICTLVQVISIITYILSENSVYFEIFNVAYLVQILSLVGLILIHKKIDVSNRDKINKILNWIDSVL